MCGADYERNRESRTLTDAGYCLYAKGMCRWSWRHSGHHSCLTDQAKRDRNGTAVCHQQMLISNTLDLLKRHSEANSAVLNKLGTVAYDRRVLRSA